MEGEYIKLENEIKLEEKNSIIVTFEQVKLFLGEMKKGNINEKNIENY